ncbi:MAG TPA: homogentisate 1,2-dioxygenase, partial [Gemmatimonadaceae bacterium]|nr:homogentisate 1,2-dioxygenase [Gemmatimonadaceae bacterium]
MPTYHTLGSIPRKRHIAFRKPDGGLYAEELMGHEGFTGTSSLLYHIYPPTTVKSVRRVKETVYEADPDQTLHHRHFLTSRVKKGGSPTMDRMPILFNADIAMLYAEPDTTDSHFYRNAQGDELVY